MDETRVFSAIAGKTVGSGIRNHVVILPLDDLSNAACEKVANNIDGCLALPHHYGRLQFGADLDLHFRTLIGTGCNRQRGSRNRDRDRAGLDRPRGGRVLPRPASR